MLKKTFFISILILITTIFQACMPVTKPFAPAKVEADKVLIYVYRTENFIARGVTWSLKLNNKVVTNYFVNNGYIPLYTESGSAEIELYQDYLGMPDGVYDKITINNVKAGEIYYIKAIPKPFSFHKLKLVDKVLGESEIDETLYYVDQKN